MADLNLSSVRLPPAFQECEYIESTGTQWIDTGVCLSRHSDFDIFYKNKASGIFANTGFGYYEVNGLTFEEQAWPTGNILIFGTNARDGYNFPVGFYETGMRHLELKGNTLFVDDAEYGHYERTPSTASPFSLLIGAWRETNGVIHSGNSGIVLGKISFSTDNQLLFHGIPCYLKTDWNNIPAGTIGMYDLCGSISSNGTPFYTNEGTGTFSKGLDVVHADTIAINGAEVDKLTDVTGTVWTKHGLMLPTAFQQCEYIESHERERIETDYRLSSNNVLYKWKAIDKGLLGSSLFGSETPYSGVLYAAINAQSRYLFVGNTARLGVGYSVDGATADSWELMLKNNYATLKKNGSITSYVGYTGTVVGSPKLSLFANGANQYSVASMYYWELYDDETLVRSFIPCYLKKAWNNIPAGTIGMYDLCGSICPLTNTPFYINAGAGAFTKGADVV